MDEEPSSEQLRELRRRMRTQLRQLRTCTCPQCGAQQLTAESRPQCGQCGVFLRERNRIRGRNPPPSSGPGLS